MPQLGPGTAKAATEKYRVSERTVWHYKNQACKAGPLAKLVSQILGTEALQGLRSVLLALAHFSHSQTSLLGIPCFRADAHTFRGPWPAPTPGTHPSDGPVARRELLECLTATSDLCGHPCVELAEFGSHLVPKLSAQPCPVLLYRTSLFDSAVGATEMTPPDSLPRGSLEQSQSQRRRLLAAEVGLLRLGLEEQGHAPDLGKTLNSGPRRETMLRETGTAGSRPSPNSPELSRGTAASSSIRASRTAWGGVRLRLECIGPAAAFHSWHRLICAPCGLTSTDTVSLSPGRMLVVTVMAHAPWGRVEFLTVL